MKLHLNALLVCALWLCAEAAPPPSPERRAREVARLEREKSALFQQLNAAIDESVRSLRAHNDSEAAVGIGYVEDLREKMKALNASPAQITSGRAPAPTQAGGAEIVDPEEDFRRKSRARAEGAGGAEAEALRQLQGVTMKQSDVKYFDSKIAFGDKARNPKRWQERYENRVVMQQKLEEWLAQREKERNDIKRLVKAAREKDEKCPRYGHMRARRKSRGSRRNAEGEGGGEAAKLDSKDLKGVPGGAGDKYPCCRKCCKKSYLGCL